MTAPSLSSDPQDELAALRRRAYGPHADIHDDAEALRRLHELETLARAGGDGGVPDAPTSAPAPPADPRGAQTRPASVRAQEVVAETVATEDAASLRPSDGVPTPAEAVDGELPGDRGRVDGAARPAPSRPARLLGTIGGWWSRTPRWAFLVGGLVLGSVLSVGIPALVAPRPVARLAVTDATLDAEFVFLPSGALRYYGLEREDLRLHEQFGQIQVLSGVNSIGEECLFSGVDDQWLNGGCAPADLGAVFDINDDYGLQALTDPELPVGSTVRLALVDDVVEVWLHEGAGQLRLSAD